VLPVNGDERAKILVGARVGAALQVRVEKAQVGDLSKAADTETEQRQYRQKVGAAEEIGGDL
jgi:hypothetical protein